jgi:hypothetical protein
MTGQEQHAEAHRLKNDLGYGARRIAQELGVSRHAATQLLARPLPQPVADEVAEPVAEPGGQAAEAGGHGAEEAQPPAPQTAEPTAPVRRVVGVAGPDWLVFQPPAAARPSERGPWLRVSFARRPGLLQTLRRLLRLGLQVPEVVDTAVHSFAAGYHHAITHGHLSPGQPYEVQTVIRPCRHRAA